MHVTFTNILSPIFIHFLTSYVLTIKRWTGQVISSRESLNISLCLVLIGGEKRQRKLDKNFSYEQQQWCGNQCSMYRSTMTRKKKKRKISEQKNMNVPSIFKIKQKCDFLCAEKFMKKLSCALICNYKMMGWRYRDREEYGRIEKKYR